MVGEGASARAGGRRASATARCARHRPARGPLARSERGDPGAETRDGLLRASSSRSSSTCEVLKRGDVASRTRPTSRLCIRYTRHRWRRQRSSSGHEATVSARYSRSLSAAHAIGRTRSGATTARRPAQFVSTEVLEVRNVRARRPEDTRPTRSHVPRRREIQVWPRREVWGASGEQLGKRAPSQIELPCVEGIGMLGAEAPKPPGSSGAGMVMPRRADPLEVFFEARRLPEGGGSRARLTAMRTVARISPVLSRKATTELERSSRLM